MARPRKNTTRTRSSLRILPETVSGFLQNRLFEVRAAAIGVLGLFLIISHITYTPTDPSWNTARQSTDHAANMGGHAGAYIADFFIQTIGLGALAIAAFLMATSINKLRRETPTLPLWLRLLSLAFATLFTSAAFARIPAPQTWDVSYLGGVFGAKILSSTSALLQGWLSGFAFTASALLYAAAALTLTAFSFGMSTAAWGYVGRLTLVMTAWLATACAYALFAARKCLSALHLVSSARGDDDEDSLIATPKKRRGTTASAIRKTPPLSSDDTPASSDDEAPIRAIRASNDITIERGAPPAKKTPKPTAPRQNTLSLGTPDGDWEFPDVNILQEDCEEDTNSELDERALTRNAELLQQVLEDFNINGEIVKIHPGPVVTLYELEPAPGTKSSRVIGLCDDIARSMSALSVRAAVVPGRNVIGIEIPNKKRRTVYMHSLVTSNTYAETRARLPMILGKNIGGEAVIADLARMPHLLVAGTTGSGKSVAVNTMITSLLYKLSPEKCRFIMIDPKMLELSIYDNIPHLLSPVVTEPGKAVVALKWTVREMEDRYRAMSKLGVRNIDGYNDRIKQAQEKGEVLTRKIQTGFDPDTGKPIFEEQPIELVELPYIVVVVDEFADLMLVAGKDVENAIQRLAQMARAAGIHLIMATQRPSVDVITGVIKANFPTRISFQVTSKIDSRTILGEGGAEQLLGQGDMLYMAAGGRIQRVHGPFVSDSEVEQIVTHLKTQGEPEYLEDITTGSDEGDTGDMFGADMGGGGGSGDDLYDRAVAVVAREGRASTSFIQRHLQIGYNKAATLIERMEKEGVITPANHAGKREVLIGDH